MKLVLKLGTERCLFGLLLFPLISFGHHSQAGRYQTETLLEYEGEIARIQWRNPHVILWLNVTENDGQEVLWEIEARASSTLLRMGITRDLFNVGDRIRVAANPPTGGVKEMWVHNLLTPNGEELLMGRLAEVRWSDQLIGSDDFWAETEGIRRTRSLEFSGYGASLVKARIYFRQPSHHKIRSQQLPYDGCCACGFG